MWQSIRQSIRTVLTLNDTPHAIALGAALGLFVGWTPTVGIQMALVFVIAPFLRANRLPALLGVYISNPYTFLPMYYIEYKLGALVFGHSMTFDKFSEFFHSDPGWLDILLLLGRDLAIPMWIGGIVLGLLTAVPAYFLTRWLLSRSGPTSPLAAAPKAPQREPADLPNSASSGETASA